MTEDMDPWANTKRLLGDDFFEPVEHITEEDVRAAFEAELEASTDQGRAFSPRKFLASLRGPGLEQLAPGHYGRGEPRPPHGSTGDGGWVSGTC